MRLPGIAFRPLARATHLTAPIGLACRTVDHSAAARNFVAVVRRRARDRGRGDS
jgi:hypothetical protein